MASFLSEAGLWRVSETTFLRNLVVEKNQCRSVGILFISLLLAPHRCPAMDRVATERDPPCQWRHLREPSPAGSLFARPGQIAEYYTQPAGRRNVSCQRLRGETPAHAGPTCTCMTSACVHKLSQARRVVTPYKENFFGRVPTATGTCYY